MSKKEQSSATSPTTLRDSAYMGRRRGQRKAHLREKGPSWIGSWREDVRDPATGQIKRPKRSRVIAPAKGAGAVSKREAQRIFWNEVLSKLDTASIRTGSMTTLRDFVALEFEPHVVSRTRSSHYRTTLKHVLPALGDKRLRDIEPADVQRFVSEKLNARLAPQTVKHLVSTLRAVYHHAKAMGYHSGDLPTEYVKIPEMRRAYRGALSPEQVRAIAEALLSPYRELVMVLACTGLRIGEACGLRWKRVNLGDEPCLVEGKWIPARYLLLREAWVRGQWTVLKTQGSEGLVPLPDLVREALVLLKARAQWAGPDDPVFAVKDGKPLSHSQAARKYLKPALRKLKLPGEISWHWFRHTLSTLSDQVGKLTEAERQRILRHSGAEMTRQYTHVELERARAGLNAVAEAIWGRKKLIKDDPETGWIN